MRAVVAAWAIALAGIACAGRQFEVRADPAPAAAVTLRVVNSLTQAVNVYVISGGNEMFLRQVPASATAEVPVQGVAVGSSVKLRAVPLDGRNRYERDATLNGLYEWRVP